MNVHEILDLKVFLKYKNFNHIPDFEKNFKHMRVCVCVGVLCFYIFLTFIPRRRQYCAVEDIWGKKIVLTVKR